MTYWNWWKLSEVASWISGGAFVAVVGVKLINRRFAS